MTIFPSGVSYIDTYSKITGTVAGSGGTLGIFQASSTANVVTHLFGHFTAELQNTSITISPTNLANPNSTNGALYMSGGTLNHTFNGANNAILGAVTNNAIYNYDGISHVYTGTSYTIFFNGFVLTPGYYLYVYNSNASAARVGYELKKVEIRQS